MNVCCTCCFFRFDLQFAKEFRVFKLLEISGKVLKLYKNAYKVAINDLFKKTIELHKFIRHTALYLCNPFRLAGMQPINNHVLSNPPYPLRSLQPSFGIE
eukprot:NODE_623_length_5907_cov_0.380165.p7 type:complete len:100 gc:universal NODE_623_length_5907_cov_0.380165:4793-4494(-)